MITTPKKKQQWTLIRKFMSYSKTLNVILVAISLYEHEQEWLFHLTPHNFTTPAYHATFHGMIWAGPMECETHHLFIPLQWNKEMRGRNVLFTQEKAKHTFLSELQA